MLFPAAAQAQGHPISAGNPAPRISVKSPEGRYYKAGTTIKFRFSCTAAKHSRTKMCKGKLLHRGSKQRAVKNGTKLRFNHAGRYMLKISTRDNKHHSQFQTFESRIK